MRAGVLALQGDVAEHIAVIRQAGAAAVPVRTASELDALDALVIPGGESTTLGLLASKHDLIEPMRKRIESGLPVFGTCAGLILLAAAVDGGDVERIGVLDVTVQRNAYGRQVDSFEEHIDVTGIGSVHAVFIRAPKITRVGGGVEVLASRDDGPAVVRAGNVLAATFHPEIAGDGSLHRFFLDEAGRTSR